MAYRLDCPCSETLYGRTEPEMVQVGIDHARVAHSRDYTAEQIMFMAMTVPDAFLPEHLR